MDGIKVNCLCLGGKEVFFRFFLELYYTSSEINMYFLIFSLKTETIIILR